MNQQFMDVVEVSEGVAWMFNGFFQLEDTKEPSGREGKAVYWSVGTSYGGQQGNSQQYKGLTF